MSLVYSYRVYPTEAQIKAIKSVRSKSEPDNEMGMGQKLRFITNICLRQYNDALMANYRTLIEQQAADPPCPRAGRWAFCQTVSQRGKTAAEKAAQREEGRRKRLEDRERRKKGLPPLNPPLPPTNPSPFGGHLCLSVRGCETSGSGDDVIASELWMNDRKPVFLKKEDQLRDLRAFIATPQGEFLKDLKSFTRDKAVENLHQAWSAFYKGNAKRPKFKDATSPVSFYFTGKPELCPSAKAKPVKESKRVWYRLGASLKKFRVRGCREFFFPGIGVMPLRLHRPMPTDPKSVRLKEEAGQWFALFSTEETRPPLSLKTGKNQTATVDTVRQAIGIDLGVVNLATDSTGEMFENPRILNKYAARKAQWQRVLALKEKGSANYLKIKAKITKIDQKVKRARRNHFYQIANAIVQKASFVVFEDLNVKNMTASASGDAENPGTNVAQKSGLNRSILDAAPGELRRIITYMVEHSGGWVTDVPAPGTSQRCSACRYTDAGNRRSQSDFCCLACGHAENADVNASKNILALGLAKLASGEVAEEYQKKANAAAVNQKRRDEMRLMASLPKDQRIARKAAKEAEREATKAEREAAKEEAKLAKRVAKKAAKKTPKEKSIAAE